MKKNLGQIFTDKWIVDLILNLINYEGKEILDKKIMEPSCGDGAFLVKIVNIYIDNALKENWTIEDIKAGLEECIYGIEIDSKHYLTCLERLNELVARYNIYDVEWKIYNEDALFLKRFDGMMDYVVGNPPYVRIHNINTEIIKYIKDNFKTCQSGIIDLYIAFYELGLNMLNKQGKLCYVTPNSFMYNSSAAVFREYIRKERLLSKIINFGSEKLFKVSTYTAIILLEKSRRRNVFEYFEYKNKNVQFIEGLNIDTFKDKVWGFGSNDNVSFVDNVTSKEENIKSIANVQYGFATLRDKIYVSNKVSDLDKEICSFNGHPVEKKLLRKIVKGSTYGGGEVTEYIIFPYEEDKNGRNIVIKEEEMIRKYPNAYNYFLSHKEELLKRDMDRHCTEWYQFGRSQGLQNMNNEKLVVKNIVKKENSCVEVYKLPKDVFVYSGIFITGDMIDYVAELLKTEEFYRYVSIVGKDLSGGYKTITTKMIKEFAIN